MNQGLGNIFNRVKQWLIPYYVRFWLYPQRVRGYRKRIRDIRRRGQANVVFLASSLAMWKYQGLYDLLSKDNRFKVTIILAPFSSFSVDQKERSMKELSSFFTSHNIPFFDSGSIEDIGLWLRQDIKPDIIFYPQPYDRLFRNALDYSKNPGSLTAYVPYGALTLNEKWIYNAQFNYLAWRLYYQSALNKRLAERMCFNKGKNVRISGYILCDEFTKQHCEVWKPQEKPKIRVIWAPHFSGINQSNWLNRGAFNWMWEFMQELAISLSNSVQFAFKPHPRLISELYKSPEWGKEKTDAYYAWWAEGKNTQLETGQFVALFQGADAMIHDCNSFIADFLLTGKPAMFTSTNITAAENQLDDFGKAALHAHYIGRNKQDILHFFESLQSNVPDPKATERAHIFQKYLLPPDGKMAAEIIYEDILSALKLRR